MELKESILTKEKIESLEKELEQLKLVKRKEIAERIKVALSYGDLSENSEYDEAKNEQGIIEAQIAEIEAVLKTARVLNEDEITTERVSSYTTVRVRNTDTGREETLTIVGATESDPFADKISDESPIGKGLIGKRKGETALIELPGGHTAHYMILNIEKAVL